MKKYLLTNMSQYADEKTRSEFFKNQTSVTEPAARNLYLYRGYAYNVNEFGNLMFGSVKAKLGANVRTLIGGGHVYSLFSNGSFDDPKEVEAVKRGFSFYERSRRLKLLVVIAMVSVVIITIIGVAYVVYENSDLKRRSAFFNHVSLFKSLENVPHSSYLIMEEYYNKTSRLDSISNILGMQVSSIDFNVSATSKNIYIRTEPYFDYSGYFYNSNTMQLNCMLKETEALLMENPQLKLSVVKLDENWMTYRKNKKDIPIDVLYFNSIRGLDAKCK